MSTFTENYNLIKPGEGDYYDVSDFNENMDTIDSQMMETEQAIEGVGEKIGSAADEGTTTVFGKLNQLANKNIPLIKSIQYVTYYAPREVYSGSCSLSQAVNPNRCLVIFERLEDTLNSGCNYVSYSLNASSINIEHAAMRTGFSDSLRLGFWVVEFY